MASCRLLCILGTAVFLTALWPQRALPQEPPPDPKTAQRVDPEPPPDPKAGQRVEWEGWSFRWSVRKMEGLVLTDVAYRGRPVLNYAGVAEALVGYAHGELTRDLSFPKEGFGINMEELLPGKDCYPGASCKAFNAQGKEEGKRLVMMHEEPLGLNYFGQAGRDHGKMLVLWSMARFPGPGGGYVYILRWRFRNDGSLLPEVLATGALQFPQSKDFPWNAEQIKQGRGPLVGLKPKELDKDADPYVASLKVGDQVHSPSHVHSFIFRLAFAVDGPEHNAVEEYNYQPDAPDSIFFKGQWTRIKQEAGRSLNPRTFRSWRVVNLRSKNALGNPRSYELCPGGGGFYRGSPKEAVLQSDLWVTRYHADEFPFSSADKRRTADALPTYLNGESVDGRKVVLWYVLSLHHEPRTEDWFPMPAARAGFELRPRDFLDASPLQPDK